MYQSIWRLVRPYRGTLLGALASYVASYYTTSVGQWVANDLRLRTYHHLHQLSLHYYDTHETGTVLSTITDDVQTIQSFASSSLLGILVDLMTIVAMVGVMLWVNWDFTLLVVAVTPFMVLLISRLRTAVKKATREVRKEQSHTVVRSMTVYFANGQAGIAPKYRAQLEQFAAQVKDFKGAFVEVEGYASAVGSNALNQH